MASLAGSGSKAEGKGKVQDPTRLPEITVEAMREQLRQNRAIFRTQQPIRRVLSQQTLEALRTGGVGARLPIAQRAVENTRIATGQSLRSAEGGLSRAGLAGTPFAQRMLAQLSQQGRFAQSQIPTAFAQQLIGSAGGGSQQLPSFGSMPSGAGPSSSGSKDLGGLGSLLGNYVQNKFPSFRAPTT